MEPIPFHKHNGNDSPKINGRDLVNSLQNQISDPSGGSVVDIEARAAIASMLDVMRAMGFIRE